jgi:hypothetical protein
MSFSKVYSAILLPFVGKYKEAKNEKGRMTVVTNAVNAVTTSRSLLEDQGLELPKNLKSVRDFFHILSPFNNVSHLRSSVATLKVLLIRKQPTWTTSPKKLRRFIQCGM